MAELKPAKAPLNDGAHANAGRATLAFVVRMLGYYAVLNGVYFLIPIATLDDHVYLGLFGRPSEGVINVLALANRARDPRPDHPVPAGRLVCR